MNYRYENWLKEKLEFIRQNFAVNDASFNDIVFDIVSEQEYAKKEDYSPTVIYVVIKKYNATPILSTKVQPMQLMILSEEYDLENTLLIFNKLVEEYQLDIENIVNEDSSYTYIKHEYQSPAVMTNFIEVGAGRRSIIYVPVTLSIMENNVSLIRNVNISINNGVAEKLTVVNLSFVYNMQGNTQQLPSKHLSETVKSVAITGINFVLQAISTSSFINNLMDVSFGLISGNSTYTIDFGNGRVLDMKLSSVQYTDAIDGTPVIQVGLTV